MMVSQFTDVFNILNDVMKVSRQFLERIKNYVKSVMIASLILVN